MRGKREPNLRVWQTAGTERDPAVVFADLMPDGSAAYRHVNGWAERRQQAPPLTSKREYHTDPVALPLSGLYLPRSAEVSVVQHGLLRWRAGR